LAKRFPNCWRAKARRSHASRYVTGTELVIDGGMNAGGVARRA
jgi:hypothetical protein